MWWNFTGISALRAGAVIFSSFEFLLLAINAGLPATQRISAHEAWQADKVQVMAATNACVDVPAIVNSGR